ncbi:hypothetical protein E9549_12975 [Blastococcus sp. MG754426]|uniref:hypothetical protein n=1 Tax=unclassified Blastococcus TaxID=2619396 RepID=UPI001EF12993|nr:MULTISPECIES: hypothetical protein [unclassified Blastococcus]MCF6508310.1 hypothetical protein [Blastococcus sp. MG754426]MCF6512971.1 hypothetical protein [Blastococcus sp. MG754427]MCF6735689.1 hypothetical protein [Blastococcus sp. KM273129]
MSAAVLLLLGLAALAGLVLALRGERGTGAAGAVALVGSLAVAAAFAWPADGGAGVAQAGAALAALAAVTGGGPVATAVLHAADPAATGVGGGPQDPDILRGGAWIGVLERGAIAATLLVGWPEGLAVVLAVKGLGRFSELRAPAAAERFIVGTLASGLWAAACVGVAVLLRG